MADGTDAFDLGVELLPADDDPIYPADALAAAVSSAVSDPIAEVADDPPEPFGLSWAFDWQAGRFIRQGRAPAEVRGLDALREWCLMAVNSARFAHAVFSDEFGMEEPDDLLGELGIAEAVSDFEERIREALLVHDRIAACENWSADWDPTTGILTIDQFDVITDEEEELSFAGLQLQPRGAE